MKYIHTLVAISYFSRYLTNVEVSKTEREQHLESTVLRTIDLRFNVLLLLPSLLLKSIIALEAQRNPLDPN